MEIDVTPIESDENILLLIEALSTFDIDSDSTISSDETITSSTIVYAENLIDAISIDTIESFENNIPIYASSEILSSSISSLENLPKQRMYPKPIAGTIYTWFEKLHTIETDLNVRDKS